MSLPSLVTIALGLAGPKAQLHYCCVFKSVAFNEAIANCQDVIVVAAPILRIFF